MRSSQKASFPRDRRRSRGSGIGRPAPPRPRRCPAGQRPWSRPEGPFAGALPNTEHGDVVDDGPALRLLRPESGNVTAATPPTNSVSSVASTQGARSTCTVIVARRLGPAEATPGRGVADPHRHERPVRQQHVPLRDPGGGIRGSELRRIVARDGHVRARIPGLARLRARERDRQRRDPLSPSSASTADPAHDHRRARRVRSTRRTSCCSSSPRRSSRSEEARRGERAEVRSQLERVHRGRRGRRSRHAPRGSRTRSLRQRSREARAEGHRRAVGASRCALPHRKRRDRTCPPRARWPNRDPPRRSARRRRSPRRS